MMSRRKILCLIGAGAAVGFSPTVPARTRQQWRQLEPVLELLGDAEPTPKGLKMELPPVSENSSAIPLTVSVDSAMTAEEHVESIHLFANRNPNPTIAAFRLTPLTGQARISTRIRLSESQTVVAVARTNHGQYRVTTRDCRVAGSGCLMRNDNHDPRDDMQFRIRVPETVTRGEDAEVLTLIMHPMETGFREDETGRRIPRLIVHSFTAHLDAAPVLEAAFNSAISANPYLRFHLRPPHSGTLEMQWEDDLGRTAKARAAVRVS